MIRAVAVTVHLDPMIVVLLQAIATHTGRTRDEVVAEGLRLLFVAIPRPDDASALERSPGLDDASALERSPGLETQWSKPGGQP